MISNSLKIISTIHPRKFQSQTLKGLLRNLNTSSAQVHNKPSSTGSLSIPTRLPISNKIQPIIKTNKPISKLEPKTTPSLIEFRPYFNRPPPQRIPPFHHEIKSVEDFLDSLKRPTLKELTNKFSSWDEFFNSNGKSMKSKSINVKERRYLLWAMELFRHGLDPKEFAVKLKKKKTIRG
ncbi:hypothetical protein CROQUDRAFT_45497 [Cronartium quercuum f. sp. fusiforme G11]|uniref:Small ribosomal subunit protein mS41 n=1 Tax=Cronartium quercuum f. sp. fusiforme G11 TaxID=708437 RepID=A0A9P6TAZ5_9BASI|nr:hypothetical protein CROQUDRAFT_45497 [Cronartium quercuum f. sp. fusiforme G11]